MGDLIRLTLPLSTAAIVSLWGLYLLWVAVGARGYAKAVDRTGQGDTLLDELRKRRGRIVLAIFGLFALVFITGYAQLYAPRIVSDAEPTGSNVHERVPAPATPTATATADERFADHEATAQAERKTTQQGLADAAATAGTGRK